MFVRCSGKLRAVFYKSLAQTDKEVSVVIRGRLVIFKLYAGGTSEDIEMDHFSRVLSIRFALGCGDVVNRWLAQTAPATSGLQCGIPGEEL